MIIFIFIFCCNVFRHFHLLSVLVTLGMIFLLCQRSVVLRWLYFQQVNIPMNKRSLNRLIDMMDVDGDGEIDFG